MFSNLGLEIRIFNKAMTTEHFHHNCLPFTVNKVLMYFTGKCSNMCLGHF